MAYGASRDDRDRKNDPHLHAEQRGDQQSQGGQWEGIRHHRPVGDCEPGADDENDEDQRNHHETARIEQKLHSPPRKIQPDVGRHDQHQRARAGIILPRVLRLDQPQLFERLELRGRDDLAAQDDDLARLVFLDDGLHRLARRLFGGFRQFGVVQAVGDNKPVHNLHDQRGLIFVQ